MATETHVLPDSRAQHHFYIQEYRVEGGEKLLPRVDVEEAVYPYLGPYRTEDDIKQACDALQKVYHDKGYAFVDVGYAPQKTKSGIIYLQVHANEIGRLRIKGSRYFSLDEMKKDVPSLNEGRVFDLTAANRELVALNQLPDRQVTVTPHPGVLPGTYDIDLNVKDTPPLHGSLEVNNRYSADTTRLRINGSLSYDNLWQLGHTIGGSFQLSPEDLSQVKVYSGFYQARVPGVDWLSLLVQGTNQDSNVNTIGGIAVAGKGQTIGARGIISLPALKDFYQSLSLGVDYKHYNQDVVIAGTNSVTPVTYFPLSAAYSATWFGKDYQTVFDPSFNIHLRGLGSSEKEFEVNRHGATGNFIYFRGDLAQTRDLPGGLQVYGKLQGQASNQPLVNSEQFSGGGLSTVRGYLESEELGDNALFGTMELRSPSLSELFGKAVDEWRFYLFSEGGWLTSSDPLPEQQASYALLSVGAGTHLKFDNHFNGSLDLGVPLNGGTSTAAYGLHLTFRVWADF